MTVEEKVANLTTSVDQLTDAVNVKKQTLDASVADSESARDQSQGYRDEARTARDESQSHANTAFGYSQDAASAVAYQDLTSIAETKAGTAVDVFVYDTSKDSDGGTWRHRTQHTSWHNEPLNTATRGGRREFPAVAVIVAEINKVTIYDGDDPALPMWMVSPQDTSYFFRNGRNASSVAAMNGKVLFGLNTQSGGGLCEVDLISDRLFRYENNMNGGPEGGLAPFNVAGRGTSASNLPNIARPGLEILSEIVNDVAMTVLPDAPIEQATGLLVPTIAVATDGGVSVIKDDETVVDIYNNDGVNKASSVFFTENFLVACALYDDDRGFRFFVIPDADIVQSNHYQKGGAREWYDDTNSDRGDIHLSAVSPTVSGVADQIAVPFSNRFARGVPTRNSGLSIVDRNPNTPTKGMVTYTTSTYNTGWMHGDIKGAFLSDGDDRDLVGGINLVTDLFSPDRTLGSGTDPWRAVISQASVSGGVLTILHDHSSSPSGRVVDTRGYIRAGYTYDITWTVDALIGDAIGSSLNVGADQSGNGGTGTAVIAGAGTHTATVTSLKDGNITLFAEGGTPAGAVAGVEISAVSVVERDADRSANGNGLIVNGTVTRSPVATGADLVAYSGFSGTNYLEQPYNPDLDFGTGDFCLMGWLYLNREHGFTLLNKGEAGTNQNPYFEVQGNQGRLVFVKNASGGNVDLGPQVVGKWMFFAYLRASGAGYGFQNGTLMESVADTNNYDHNNADILRIGLRTDGYNGPDGSTALIRISATAPTAEQIKRIYEDEKVLFQENAQATLYGASDAVTALAHDPKTNLLHVGTSDGRSVFDELLRVDHTETPVGTAISAVNGLIVEG